MRVLIFLKISILSAVLAVSHTAAAPPTSGGPCLAKRESGLKALVECLLPQVDLSGQLKWPAFQPLLDQPELLDQLVHVMDQTDRVLGAVPVFGSVWQAQRAIAESARLEQMASAGVWPDERLAAETRALNRRWRDLGISAVLDIAGTGSGRVAVAAQTLGIGRFVLTLTETIDPGSLAAQRQALLDWAAARSAPGRLLVLLDRSGSMKQSDPKRLALESLRLLATIASAEAEIGVIAFSDQARWVVPPAPAGLPGSPTRRAMLEAAMRLAPGGGTDIAAALALAATGADRDSRLILLGDGEDKGWSGDPGPLPAGARVDTIAFTDRAGIASLQALSKASGGRFMLAPDADAMRRALSAQMFDAQAAPLLLDLQGRVNTGQMLVHPLTVDPDTAALSLALEWPGSDLDLVAIAPDGSRHTARDGGLVSGTVEALRIARPMPGQWRVEVTGIDTAADGSVFSLRAAAEGGLVPLSLDTGSQAWQHDRPLTVHLRSTPPLAWHTAVVTWRDADGQDLTTATVRVQPDGSLSAPLPPSAGPLRLEVSATATTGTGSLVRQAALERMVVAAPVSPAASRGGQQDGWFAITGD